ncbi:hypothetical protein ACGVWS_05685 [Enterobacteriaceae bacterium LUAb1]
MNNEFIWDPDKNQIYTPSYGSQSILEKQPGGFDKNIQKSFLMIAPGETLTMHALAEAVEKILWEGEINITAGSLTLELNNKSYLYSLKNITVGGGEDKANLTINKPGKCFFTNRNDIKNNVINVSAGGTFLLNGKDCNDFLVLYTEIYADNDGSILITLINNDQEITGKENITTMQHASCYFKSNLYSGKGAFNAGGSSRILFYANKLESAQTRLSSGAYKHGLFNVDAGNAFISVQGHDQNAVMLSGEAAFNFITTNGPNTGVVELCAVRADNGKPVSENLLWLFQQGMLLKDGAYIEKLNELSYETDRKNNKLRIFLPS